MAPQRGSFPVGLVLPLLLAATAAAMIAAIMVGSADLPASKALLVLWQAIQAQPKDDTIAQIVLGIRLPRVLLAVCHRRRHGLGGSRPRRLSSETP